MKTVSTASLAALLIALSVSSALAQRSGTRGPSTSHARIDPAEARAETRTGGRAGNIRRGRSPLLGANRGILPVTWWWFTDVDMPYALEAISPRTAIEPVSPAQPDVPAQPALIQPMLTLPRPQTPRTSLRGNLKIDVTPATAQVLVDGFYMGTVEDIARLGAGLDIAAGWHRVEFRAPGFATLSANVTVDAGGSFSYRAELKPIAR